MPNTAEKTDWHPADIKAALEKRGYTLSRISRDLGYKHHNMAHQVLMRPWPKIEQAVARVIGVPAREIWPSRYARRAMRTELQNPSANRRRAVACR